jgi:hypothetical protein
MIGDPDAAACEGDFCALPAEPKDENAEDDSEAVVQQD